MKWLSDTIDDFFDMDSMLRSIKLGPNYYELRMEEEDEIEIELHTHEGERVWWVRLDGLREANKRRVYEAMEAEVQKNRKRILERKWA